MTVGLSGLRYPAFFVHSAHDTNHDHLSVSIEGDNNEPINTADFDYLSQDQTIFVSIKNIAPGSSPIMENYRVSLVQDDGRKIKIHFSSVHTKHSSKVVKYPLGDSVGQIVEFAYELLRFSGASDAINNPILRSLEAFDRQHKGMEN